MYLQKINLQNFRSYKKSSFAFSKDTNIIVGPNTSGKTNIIEAIFMLSRAKSFRSDKDSDLISLGKSFARVLGQGDAKLEVVLSTGELSGGRFIKKFLVNGVSKRRVDFCSNLKTVLFNPEDLEIIIGSPSLRRNFLDEVLEQVDREYAFASISYSKALRQRNALLDKTREALRLRSGQAGARNERQFEYWDELLIKNGQIIAEKRKQFIEFINNGKKEIIDFTVYYDKSEISKARLLQYKDAEVGAGVTLVGPHRDDFLIQMHANKSEQMNVKHFGSRGQQRLVILQLKLLQIVFMEKSLGHRPLLLLDDIFSELDESHIQLVLEKIGSHQIIITTTHEEFIPNEVQKKAEIIELEK